MEESHFDAVVVGSGFGGSVMGHRLAEAGQARDSATGDRRAVGDPRTPAGAARRGHEALGLR